MNTKSTAADRNPVARSSISSLSSTISEDLKTPNPATSSEQYKLDPKYVSFGGGWQWREGAIHHGHPSIIPLLEFFEDAHFYYLMLPAATPSFPPSPNFPPISLPASHPSSLTNGFAEKKFPSDLFDLVERFPYGLPPALIRTYLGQIADGLAFLHARGICHRDIKDENIVLAEDGRCWLIDFGSSGIIRNEGWDTFSGT
jgi:protein-serine/threonine kinase